MRPLNGGVNIFRQSFNVIPYDFSGITPDPTIPEPTTMLGLLAVGAFSFVSRRRQK